MGRKAQELNIVYLKIWAGTTEGGGGLVGLHLGGTNQTKSPPPSVTRQYKKKKS